MSGASRRLTDGRQLAGAAWQTWGAKGLARRAVYETAKRTHHLRRVETHWLERSRSTGALVPLGISPPGISSPGASSPGASSPGIRAAGAGAADSGPTDLARAAPSITPIQLYGGLDLATAIPPDWHRHPLTGHRFDPTAHWSELSDASADQGDIKDLWELSRFGWPHPWLRRWAAAGDESVAEAIWTVVEDWVAHNPPYRGPHWMCGQETSLRAINALFLADALTASAATTDDRRAMVATLVDQSVGRVEPTLGYALSQRNNHATSEAGFLWSATLAVDGLADAEARRARAGHALSEAVADQFAGDGSYAQHSPTYERVALHVLLWCLHVARATGTEAPDGVTEAVGRSVGFLRSLVAPGSAGRVPNLGGNDGAQVFDLTSAAITDLRPIIAHAAAATGQRSGFGPGPWDEEAAWFALSPSNEGPEPSARPTVSTHALTQGTGHAVLRAGPLRHRPAHADQLHVDVWIDGAPVAVDPGSYRYTAPAPWGNALAGEEVHNLPRVPGCPQAVRAGRFFWRRWTDAQIRLSVRDHDLSATVADLVLPDATHLTRLVAVAPGVVVVVDQASGPAVVRWNLSGAVSVAVGERATSAQGPGWSAQFLHGGGAEHPIPDSGDPSSGWEAPSYAVRRPLSAVLVPTDEAGQVVSCFAPDRDGPGADLDEILGAAGLLDLDRVGGPEIRRLLRPRSASTRPGRPASVGRSDRR